MNTELSADTFDIQKLVAVSGVPRRTIYFYVQQGLLPPPQGAGLAAYYTENHLVRLRLIPILRQEGLRLDDIREKFSRMSLEEMHRRANEAVVSGEVQSRIEPVNIQDNLPPPSAPAQVRDELVSLDGWPGQNFLHFSLPGGITLTVPSNMSLVDQQRLRLLLRAAGSIFANPVGQPVVHDQDASGERPNLAMNDKTSV